MNAACDVTLERELSHEQADHVVTVLNRSGVAATTSPDVARNGRYRIEVSASAVEAAVGALLADRESSTATDRAAAIDDAPLFESHEQQLARADRTLERELSDRLERVEGVRQADVHIYRSADTGTLADLERAPVTPAPRVSVSITRIARARSTATQVSALVRAAFPTLTPDHLMLVERLQPEPETACAALSHVGPIAVVRDSASTLKLWLALALLVHMLLACALLYVLTRNRRARREST